MKEFMEFINHTDGQKLFLCSLVLLGTVYIIATALISITEIICNRKK